MQPLLWTTLGLLLLYGLALFGVAWGTLHPLRVPIFLSPGALGLPQLAVQFNSSDGVDIKGWWMHRPGAKTVIVLAHGFMMNRAEGTPLAKRLYEEGCACLLFDFRRHGGSGGKRSTIGWAEQHDVTAAFNEAKAQYPDAKVVIWGSSMGAAATVFAVAHQGIKPDGLVLDSMYSRLVDANSGWWTTFVGPALMPLLVPSWVFCWAITGVDPRHVDVARDLKKLTLPMLLIYGGADLIVPKIAAERNLAANPSVEIAWFPGIQHSQPRWLETDKYDATVLQFLEKHGLWNSSN